MNAKHELKTLARYFDAVWSGAKTFEVRYDDRGYEDLSAALLDDIDEIERSANLDATTCSPLADALRAVVDQCQWWRDHPDTPEVLRSVGLRLERVIADALGAGVTGE